MRRLQALGALLALGAAAAHADPCQVTIESNDQMQYSAHEIAVPVSCSEVEVTLKHAGHLPAKVMGHDWVLARDADVSGLVAAGQAAGAAHGYLPQHDARILAATELVGGGQSSSVKFSTAALSEGARYAFFCTSPGHAAMMRGRFVFGGATRVAQAK